MINNKNIFLQCFPVKQNLFGKIFNTKIFFIYFFNNSRHLNENIMNGIEYSVNLDVNWAGVSLIFFLVLNISAGCKINNYGFKDELEMIMLGSKIFFL